MNVTNYGGWMGGVEGVCIWVGEAWDHYLAARRKVWRHYYGLVYHSLIWGQIECSQIMAKKSVRQPLLRVFLF